MKHFFSSKHSIYLNLLIDKEVFSYANMCHSRMKQIMECTASSGDCILQKKPSIRHGSRNQTKSKEFVKWLICKFDKPYLRHVLDVAGGKGELAARLTMCHKVRVTLVDPRVSDVSDVYVRTVVPRLPNKWQDRLAKKLENNPQFVRETVASRFEQYVMYFTEDTVGTDKRLMAAIDDCTLLVGLHADSATECIVDAAIAAKKPFVVVPCCVFPNFFKQRTVLEDGVHRPVRNYDQFCEYLLQKDCRLQKSVLPFEGRNVAVWWDGKD